MGFATASALIGIGSSVFGAVNSMNEKKKMQQQIDSFQPQELRNPYKDIAIDTTAADQQTAANQTNVATSVDALQRGGSRALAAALPKINQQSINLQERISADIANKAYNRDMQIAQGEERIMQMQEQREREMLAGLGQGLNVANQNFNNSIEGVAQGITSLGSARRLEGGSPMQPVQRSQRTAINLYQPAGLANVGTSYNPSNLNLL